MKTSRKKEIDMIEFLHKRGYLVTPVWTRGARTYRVERFDFTRLPHTD